jgi:hypothetical protein
MISIKNILLTASAVAALGLTYFGWREYSENNALIATASVSADRLAALTGRLATTEKRAKDLEDEIAEQRRRSASSPAADAGPENRRPGGSGRSRLTAAQRMEAMAAALNDPDIQRALALKQRDLVNSRYAAFFKSLGLPPEQLAHLQTLLTERQSVVTDAIAAELQQGMSPFQNLDDFRQIVANAQAEVNSSIQAALGESGYSQLTNYDETALFRNATTRLQNDLIATNNALSENQLGSFTNGIVSLAQGQFSPAQLQALQQLDQAQQIRQQLTQVQQLYQQTQLRSNPPGP